MEKSSKSVSFDSKDFDYYGASEVLAELYNSYYHPNLMPADSFIDELKGLTVNYIELHIDDGDITGKAILLGRLLQYQQDKKINVLIESFEDK